MNRDEVFARVCKVVSETFFFPITEIRESTTADDVDGWDSLKHTILMVRLEKAFGIRLVESVAEAANVGELADRIATLNPGG